jgi:hypothetical protein
MMLSERELTQARETVAALLETLGLSAYLFEVEPREGHWEVRVECALDSGWQSARFAVDDALLAAARTDTPARDALLADWRQRLTPFRPG